MGLNDTETHSGEYPGPEIFGLVLNETAESNAPSRPYDLEDRTFTFARSVRQFVKTLSRTLANIEDARQLINSSGSVGANYIEANEALTKKDFLMRVKICRKEAKESRYWLRLLSTEGRADVEAARDRLVTEASELTNIFGAIIRKTEEKL